MATYTAAQLSGSGILLDQIIPDIGGGGVNFQITNPSSGSSYFTFETVRNNNGTYAGITPTVSGDLNISSNAQNLVSSSFIWSVSVDPGVIGSINFDPDTSIPADSAFIRATGDISVEIS